LFVNYIAFSLENTSSNNYDNKDVTYDVLDNKNVNHFYKYVSESLIILRFENVFHTLLHCASGNNWLKG
jgi:hypothetical protein